MSEMIERVALAIMRVETEDKISDYYKFARAAIEAMREPTEDMKNCSEEIHWGYRCQVCGGLTEGWQIMIDAALTSGVRK